MIESIDFTLKTPTDTLAPAVIANANGYQVPGIPQSSYMVVVNGYDDKIMAQEFPVKNGYNIEGFLILGILM